MHARISVLLYRTVSKPTVRSHIIHGHKIRATFQVVQYKTGSCCYTDTLMPLGSVRNACSRVGAFVLDFRQYSMYCTDDECNARIRRGSSNQVESVRECREVQTKQYSTVYCTVCTTWRWGRHKLETVKQEAEDRSIWDFPRDRVSDSSSAVSWTTISGRCASRTRLLYTVEGRRSSANLLVIRR